MAFDLYFFNFINEFAGKWKLLDNAGIFFAVWAGYILIIFLIVFLLADFKKYWRMVLEALLAALFVRFILVEIFYSLHFRLRPFVYKQFNFLIPYDDSKTSFPSGHASFYFALSTIIYGYNKKAGILFYGVSLLISVARVFVGVHWPSDILAGAVLGIFTGWALNKLFKKI